MLLSRCYLWLLKCFDFDFFHTQMTVQVFSIQWNDYDWVKRKNSILFVRQSVKDYNWHFLLLKFREISYSRQIKKNCSLNKMFLTYCSVSNIFHSAFQIHGFSNQSGYIWRNWSVKTWSHFSCRIVVDQFFDVSFWFQSTWNIVNHILIILLTKATGFTVMIYPCF